MKKSRNTVDWVLPLIFLVSLLVLWQVLVEGGAVPSYILPTPIAIVKALIRDGKLLYHHSLTTLAEALIGFMIAIGVALLLAGVMDNLVIVKKTLYPLIVISQTVPVIALAPLFGLWFGFGFLPKVIVVVLVCFFPVVVSLVQGFAAVDQDMINLMLSMGAKRYQIIRWVKIPAALPSFFGGLKIAATYSIMGAVIGEWLGGKEGLGVYMMRVKNSYRLDSFFAAIGLIVGLSMAIFAMIQVIEYWLMPWHREQKKDKKA